MQKLSAKQPDLFDDDGSSPSGQSDLLVHKDSESSIASIDIPKISNFPNPEAFAQSNRLAGRINAANVSDDEINKLLEERQKLLDKMFSNEISKKESNRLEYVRWSLDRIEDAKNGHILDSIEYFAERYEHFIGEVNKLDLRLNQLSGKRK